MNKIIKVLKKIILNKIKKNSKLLFILNKNKMLIQGIFFSKLLKFIVLMEKKKNYYRNHFVILNLWINY